MEKVVIIGGGIAGLSCLNALLDNNVSPLLIEGATIGTPKMCGEFLAPPAVTLLNNWEIGPLQKIQQAHFQSNTKNFQLKFSPDAGAMKRSDAEILLAHRARKKQGRIKEQAHIKKIIPPHNLSSPYIFHLASGEEIISESAIFAIGKHGQPQTSSLLPYYGIKLHLPYIFMQNTLLMYSLKDAYFGIVPVSNAISNLACLVKKDQIQKIGNCKKFFLQIINNNAHLKNFFETTELEALPWFESPAPHFQPKIIPNWPKSYWIGDALASFHPAIGSGFSHGIESAILAADFFLQANSEKYLRLAKSRIKSKILLGNMMHRIMLNPFLSSVSFPLFQYCPFLLNTCLKSLGYKF